MIRGTVVRAVVGAAGATALLLILTSVAPHLGRRLIAGWLVVLAYLATRALLQALVAVRARGRSAFDAALRPATPALTPAGELDRVHRLLLLGSASATHAQTGLLPRLRRLAADRLAERHGVRLDTDPDAARQALGEVAWGLVRPDAPRIDDRFARGPTPAAIDETIRALEGL